jgi:adenosylmethionine-8-amino-7-oxononanoate aminotransferase
MHEYIPNTILNKGGELALALKNKGVILRGNSKSLIFSPGFYMTHNQIDYIFGSISDEMK